VLARHLRLPAEYSRPIDTAAVVIVSRALAQAHKQRADRLLARLASATQLQLARHEQYMLERAERDKDLARRWIALAKVMVDGSR
jgi:PIN domain nuclease of toxin-antitoxin system